MLSTINHSMPLPWLKSLHACSMWDTLCIRPAMSCMNLLVPTSPVSPLSTSTLCSTYSNYPCLPLVYYTSQALPHLRVLADSLPAMFSQPQKPPLCIHSHVGLNVPSSGKPFFVSTFLLFVLSIPLLRYNLYTIKFTYLKGRIQWFLVYFQSCATFSIT